MCSWTLPSKTFGPWSMPSRETTHRAMNETIGNHHLIIETDPVITATYLKYGRVISQIWSASRRVRAGLRNCFTFVALVQGLLNAQSIPGYHLVSMEDCGNPIRSAHLVEENMSGEYGADLFPSATLEERTYSEGATVTYRYAGLPSSALYKVRAVYLSDTPDRVVKVMAGDVVVDGPFTEPKGKISVREFDIPGPAIQNGQLALKFQYAGDHPSDDAAIRISSIELWSTSAAIAGNLLLTADGDDHGQIVGHVTNWLYEPTGEIQVQ